MLERVSLGQSRFITPGIAPDPRGVVLGRHGMLLFPTLEGVVSWLRLYSAESSMDELLAGMSIMRVHTPLGSRAMALQIPATSSYALDRAARCARLVGATTFTGTSNHFVRYRDDRSPYGYDAVEINALPRGADFMLHDEEFAQTYAREGELAFDKLLFRLSLRRKPGSDKLRPDERHELFLVVAKGLGDGIIRYLWRNRVLAEVGLVSPKVQSSFRDLGEARGYLIIRVRDIPERILELFLATPGIDVFRSVAPNVAVQVGYSHVIDLSSCASLFASDSYYLFWGGIERVDVVAGPLALSGVEHLARIEINLEKASEPHDLGVLPAEAVGVPVQLVPSLASARHVVATLIPLDQAHRLKQLVYALPRTALRGHRVAITDRGILLLARADIDVVPLGQLLSEIAPGLLAPLGMDLVPRVAPEVLSRALGHSSGMFTVFPHEGNPFQIGEEHLVPLERRSVAKIEVDDVHITDARAVPAAEPQVQNDPVGRFSLWGFPAPKSTKLLGS